MVMEYAKKPEYWLCTECGARYTSEPMQCSKCRAIDSFEAVFKENAKTEAKKAPILRKPAGVRRSEVVNIVNINPDESERITTGSQEFDRVLGGGITTDGIVSIAGDPGAGKSTLLLMVAGEMSKRRRVLYVSGEESGRGLRDRSDRLGITREGVTVDDIDLYVVFETDMKVLLEEHLPKLQPDVIIVDSIQTLYSSDIDGTPGYEKQLMYCSIKLQEYAKGKNVAVFLVSQATKSGDMAGSNKLLHLVDAGLHLTGDDQQSFRLLRSYKNRINNAEEVGVFRMSGTGLTDVPNPSEEFLAERMIANPGSAVAVTMEGERPILVEVQALTSLGGGGNPARHMYGFNRDRAFIPVVLDRYLPYVDLADEDLTTNVVGGITIRENAADLTLATAIVSSHHNVPTPADWICIGEIGLTGEVRSVPRIETRIKEAAKIGFKHVVVPRLRESISRPKGIKIHEIQTVDEAMRLVFSKTITFSDF